ncbi:MAG TPA: glycosyl hydrolase 108 family protein, partial [Thermoanaerobaculia bacterium]|nr:glycosyl hydrolase 108 family protein [Thermoanaerobaculia bacterium]
VSDDFERALEFTLRWEGGKVDDPHDHGGRTNRGITQRTYDGWRSDHDLPARDVYLLEEDELQDIYRTLYWWVAKGEEWPASLVTFDTAVLFGASRAAEWLQAASWADVAPAKRAWAILCLRRERHRDRVAKDRTQARFWAGWMNRLNDLARFAGLVPGSMGGAQAPNS